MEYSESFAMWNSSDELTADEKARLAAMTEDEKKESFWQPLEFGTAGMRGIIDMGTNRMNRFTVRRATKGLADYITTLGAEAMNRGVVIACDTRRFSKDFAVLSAKVLSAAGVKVFLYEDVRPVPMCSFAIRYTGAIAGIMITASHNPKVYNGYKVYGDDGAQMSPEATDKVVEFISKTPYFGIKECSASFDAESVKGLDGVMVDDNVKVIGASVDKAYFEQIEKLGLSPDAVSKFGGRVKIVYTPVHGTGYMPVTTVLARMGINVTVVPEQAKPDSEFFTVRVPNPEEADTLRMGVELADKIGSDVVIGTDPDADRMGVAIRDDKGKFVLLNGNRIGVLLADYIMRRKKEAGTLPANGAIVKTIVSTELARKVADSYGVKTFDVLTGFKFIGEKIKEWEKSGEYVYLFGFEESYGSLAGTHARDKDAVVAAMLFAEMICYYDSIGKSVYSVLQDIFRKFGYFCETATSITFGGIDGMDKMRGIMKALRARKYDSIEGVQVVASDDLVDGVSTLSDGSKKAIDLPRTNALKLHLAGGDWICVRPSGTEPKLKIYAASSADDMAKAESKAGAYLAFMKSLTE